MPRPSKSKPAPKTSGKPSRKKAGRGGFRPLRWIRYLVLGFFLSTTAAVLFFRFVPPPITPLMAIRGIGNALHGNSPILDKDWEPMENISPRLAEAVVASEDQRFFDHHGFDLDAIVSAFTVNGRGKRKLGASTITQQTAKNLFLWPERSWTRKGLEAYFTFLLELLWSKQRILEVYLNIIETGDGTYGAQAAAQRYFHVTASALTAPQAALLAAILPNPRKWSPVNPTGYLQRRQTWILRQMDHLGPLPDGLSRGGPPMPARAMPRTRQSSLDSDNGAFSDTFPELPPPESPAPGAPEAGPQAPETDLPAPPARPSETPPYPETPETGVLKADPANRTDSAR
ncbi:MAG: monofunctional biosynthetic peptidoglycantransglycosylase [Fibrobacteres bacterium]|nr:monofunctional biosynthetic peptidoglycantransglycosylase [Fibrobacterota bacterium]